MSSRFPEACLLAACMLLPGLAGAAELRVCADPDNLPYSDAAGRGFENRIASLARGEVDAILAWGPQAGYFARRATPPLALDVLQAPAGMPGVPFQFSISMGVRRGDRELRDKLDAVIEHRRADIEAILDAYGVP